MIEAIPDEINLSQDYLVKYWEVELGVSRGRLEQATRVVGSNSKALRKFLKDGHRIAIRDDAGVGRQVVRITLQDDGFGVQVPYHPAKNGWIYELPADYAKSEDIVPLSAGKHYTVSDVVKLSFHMNGFVQFSRGGGRPIVSGYNPSLKLIKGAGLRAPDPVHVTTGPLFGVQVYGIEAFDECATKPVEMFEPADLWYRAGETTANDTAFNVEVFMLPNAMLRSSVTAAGKRMLRHRLPYRSQIWFEHDIRVVELPHQSFFLGVIVSRLAAVNTISSGYRIGGPGCGGPGEAKKCIAAVYPCPEIARTLNPVSLDLQLQEAGERGDK